MPAKYIVSNSISYSKLADNIISISPDVLGGNKEPQTTLIFVDDDKPYNLNLVEQQTGLSLHTKKTKQDPNVWDSAVKRIKDETQHGCVDIWGNDLKRSSMTVLILDRMNFKLSNDCWPGSINYLATFEKNPYLDPIQDINNIYNLTPIDDFFDLQMFDQTINRKFDKARDIIYLDDSDNHLITLCEYLIAKHKKLNSFTPETLRVKLLGQPWFVMEILLLTDENPWKVMENNFSHVFQKLDEQLTIYKQKQKDKIKLSLDNPQITIVDLGMLHFYSDEEAESIYRDTCKKLDIKPNITGFQQLRNNKKEKAVGIDPIDNKYKRHFESIANLLLGYQNICNDTSLSSIGWHLGCQIAFKGAIAEYNETIELDFSNCEVVADILDSINTDIKEPLK